MTLSPSEALATLGLTAEQQGDRAAIERAFERLARRYPPSHFPDRFKALLDSRDALIRDDLGWRQILHSKALDLSWAAPYLTQQTPSPPAVASDRQLMQDLLRQAYLASPEYDEMDDLDLPPDIDFGELDGMLKNLKNMLGGRLP